MKLITAIAIIACLIAAIAFKTQIYGATKGAIAVVKMIAI